MDDLWLWKKLIFNEMRHFPAFQAELRNSDSRLPLMP